MACYSSIGILIMDLLIIGFFAGIVTVIVLIDAWSR